MSVRTFIEHIIDTELADSNCFYVGFEGNEDGGKMSFFIDGDEGVDVGICSKLSRTISAAIEESEFNELAFRYEISSPGADKALVNKRQYLQHVGRELEITLNSGDVIQGQLLKVAEDELTLARFVDKKKKTTSAEKFQFDIIETSKVLISFKTIKK